MSGKPVRRSVRAAIVTAVATLVGLESAPAASAYSAPPDYEWWFSSWQVERLVWPISQGDGVTVAVLDTGVQASLPELSGVVLPGIDLTGTGGDGRIDTDSASVPGHGTGMAALIAAQGGPPTGFLGLAPKAKILPVTVQSSSAADPPGIRYAVDHGAKVINISLAVSSSCEDDLQQAIGYAIDHDVVVVAGAGNSGDKDNPRMQPADCAGVLAVGAVGVSGDSFAPLPITERQPYVTVGAAGSGGSILKDGQYHTASKGGTSEASALTSATVALVRAKFPDMPAREVVHRIIASCLDVDPPGKDLQTGYGIIRPNRTLTGDLPADAPNPVFDAYDHWKASTQTATPTSQATTASDSSTSWLPVAYAVGAGIVVVVVIAIIVTRRRRRQAP